MGGSGGGGGGSYYTARDIEQLQREARERLERSRSDSEINALLQDQLATINDRDIEATNRRLDIIEGALRERVEEIDRLVFGGSVAKHTYVDGLSDVDCLVLLKDESLSQQQPAEVLGSFRDALLASLPRGEIREISVGKLAVTLHYRDGGEIQVLPAVRSGDQVSISSTDSRSWVAIQPRRFAEALSDSNRNQGGAVVPAIKLAKAIVANRLDEPPSGYHVEALAIAAFRDYAGPRTPKAMLTRFFEQAASDVLRPIADITGQSRYLDSYLGQENSLRRRRLSSAFRDIGNIMSRSTSVSEWRSLIE